MRQKSIYTGDYKTFLSVLRLLREKAGLKQEDVAERIGMTQSMYSKCERGERRIDLMELRSVCKVLDMSLSDFVRRLEKELKA